MKFRNLRMGRSTPTVLSRQNLKYVIAITEKRTRGDPHVQHRRAHGSRLQLPGRTVERVVARAAETRRKSARAESSARAVQVSLTKARSGPLRLRARVPLTSSFLRSA